MDLPHFQNKRLNYCTLRTDITLQSDERLSVMITSQCLTSVTLVSLTVSVDFLDQFVQNLFVERLTHQSEDVGHHIGGDAATLFPVEAVKCLAKD